MKHTIYLNSGNYYRIRAALSKTARKYFATKNRDGLRQLIHSAHEVGFEKKEISYIMRLQRECYENTKRD